MKLEKYLKQREPLKNPKMEGEVVSSLLGILCDGVDCLVSGDHADEFKDYFSKIRMEREIAATMKVFDGGCSAIIVGGWGERTKTETLLRKVI